VLEGALVPILTAARCAEELALLCLWGLAQDVAVRALLALWRVAAHAGVEVAAGLNVALRVAVGVLGNGRQDPGRVLLLPVLREAIAKGLELLLRHVDVLGLGVDPCPHVVVAGVQAVLVIGGTVALVPVEELPARLDVLEALRNLGPADVVLDVLEQEAVEDATLLCRGGGNASWGLGLC